MGAWIETSTYADTSARKSVAPYVGAWIETKGAHTKNNKNVAPYVGAWIETVTSRVLAEESTVAPYVGAWIETHPFQLSVYHYICRTLCGCVD